MLPLNRRERDMLREHIMRELDGNPVDDRADDYGASWGREVARYVSILEEIGWEPEGDRDSYSLSMEPEALQAVLRRFLDYASEVYSDDSREMLRYRERPIPDEWKLPGKTEEETREYQRKLVGSAAEGLGVTDDMFMRAVQARREKEAVA